MYVHISHVYVNVCVWRKIQKRAYKVIHMHYLEKGRGVIEEKKGRKQPN